VIGITESMTLTRRREYGPRRHAAARPRRVTYGSLDLLQVREIHDVVRGLDRHHLGQVRGVVAGVVALAAGLEGPGEPDRVAGGELERGVVQRIALLADRQSG